MWSARAGDVNSSPRRWTLACLTIPYREGRNTAQIITGTCNELLVDLVARLTMHNTCSIDLRISKVIEYPFSRRRCIIRIDNEIVAWLAQDGHSMLSKITGTIQQMVYRRKVADESVTISVLYLDASWDYCRLTRGFWAYCWLLAKNQNTIVEECWSLVVDTGRNPKQAHIQIPTTFKAFVGPKYSDINNMIIIMN